MIPPGKFLRLCFAAILLVAAIPYVQAKDEPEEAPVEAGTARDLINKADLNYNSRKYAEAIKGYETFLTSYGSLSEAKEFIPHVRFNLAAALMQSQKYDADVTAIKEAQKIKELGEAKQEDLAFWLGVALIQSDEPEKGREALQKFLTDFPKSRRRPDASYLSAASWIAQNKFKEAAEAMTPIRKSPRSPHRGRAVVLELHGLIESKQFDKALDLVAEEGAKQDDIPQIATFQLLAMQLGEQLLDNENPREAIRALQPIWSHERLLKHQNQRLNEVKQKVASIEAQDKPDVFVRAQERQLAKDIEKELQNLKKIPSFDASVRFRMASAFHQMDRYLETALLLDDVLRKMPPDAISEKASMTALQSWMAIQNYDKTIADADEFATRFPASKQLPLALYLKGVAQQQAQKYNEAIKTFEEIMTKFPGTPQAVRSLFMKGFTQLLAEDNEAAAQTFGEFVKKYPKDELVEPALFWQGSALAFAKKFIEAREVLDLVPKSFPKGAMVGPAAFRKAYSAQSMREYETAERELQAYLRKYPSGEENAEARILLGDALLAQAKSDEGKEIYSSIPESAGRFYEDAQFKLAKVLKLEEDYEGLRALMQNYLGKYPNSPRAADALFQIGQAWKKEDRKDKAIEEYWKAIKTYGNDPDAYSIEDLFLALSRLYQGDSEKKDYLADLRALRQEAETNHQKVLALRTVWALSQAVKKSDPALSQALLREASMMVDPAVTSPVILLDVADVQMQTAAMQEDAAEGARRREMAAQLYRDLLKWHPRAPQKDKALGALARLAMDKGDTQTALDYYGRIERDTPWSSLMGDVLLTRAKIELAEGRMDEAADSYTRLLAAENVKGKLKAESLLALGDLEMARKRPEVAIPYYQRIYILYGKWRHIVAQAYLKSGEAFEKLNDAEAARKTYEELSTSEDLKELPEALEARERLKKFPGSSPTAERTSS